MWNQLADVSRTPAAMDARAEAEALVLESGGFVGCSQDVDKRQNVRCA